jgi:hypothetical protein
MGLLGADLPASASQNSAVTQTAQVQQWSSAVTHDVQTQSEPLIGLVETANDWGVRQTSVQRVRATISNDLPQLQMLVQTLEALPVPSTASEASTRFELAIELYVQAFRIEYVATEVEYPRLQHQLELSYRRVRDLGDRVFDLGTALVATLLHEPPQKSDERLPSPVPDWTSRYASRPSGKFVQWRA